MEENREQGYQQDYQYPENQPAQGYSQSGYQQTQGYSQSARAVVHDAIPEKSHNTAVGALVCGILGILFFWCPGVNLVLNIVGIICAVICLSKGNPGKGMAVAGLITAIIGLVLSGLILFFMIWGMALLY